MKYRLMDVLACPYDKTFPLKLYIFEEKEYPERKINQKKPLCELFCAFKNKFIKNLKSEPPCDECIKKEITYGLLYCPKCGRWYPIIDEIPIMLPDNYRKKREDISFLKKFEDKIPIDILYKGLPYNLSQIEKL